MQTLTEDDIKKNVSENIQFLMWKYDIESQVKMSKMTGVATAQLSRLINKEQIPTVSPFLMKIREKFEVSVDSFLYTNLREEYEKTFVSNKQFYR